MKMKNFSDKTVSILSLLCLRDKHTVLIHTKTYNGQEVRLTV